MTDILNATPQVIPLGTRDFSNRLVPIRPLNIPQHLPKLYIYAEKGPEGPYYVSDTSNIVDLYGARTFDPDQPYFTHQTAFLQAIFGQGNACVVHRIVPSDARVAYITLAIAIDDQDQTNVTYYARNADGSFDTSSSIATNGVERRVRWLVGISQTPPSATPSTSNNITTYPILSIRARFPGSYANRYAIRLYPVYNRDDSNVPFPSEVLDDGNNFPYVFELVRRNDDGTVRPVINRLGAFITQFAFEENFRHPTTRAYLGFERVLSDYYIDTPVESDSATIGSVTVYRNNLNTVLDILRNVMYSALSIVGTDPRTDQNLYQAVTPNDPYRYLVNIIGLSNSDGSPYYGVRFFTLAELGSDYPTSSYEPITLTPSTNVYLRQGFDGTMSYTSFEGAILADLDNYSDPASPYMDMVRHPESVLYDSGFTLPVKEEMCKFISRRKDTVVILSTYVVGSSSNSLSNQISVGQILKTRLELYPESISFGTPVMRGVLVVGSGVPLSGNYRERLPLTYEIAIKAARYMGASNGMWRNGYLFDRSPNNVINEMGDIDIDWLPATTRNDLWRNGMNFALRYSVNTSFFPALQTIYPDDTSVLNSFFTMMAISYLNKVSYAAWREFTGSISLTNAQLEERVNDFVRENTKDKFDGLFVIRPEATVTELDALRGYSWTLPIKIYANNMKTVMTTYIEAYRMTDL